MLLIIDNYDSFVHNIVQVIDYDEKNIILKRNDQFKVEDIEKMDISHIIISPGPMSPSESGLSNEVIKRYAGKIPILGICLGHQCIGHVFGCRVEQHPFPTHGRKNKVKLERSIIFEGLPDVIEAGRYHSLYISKEGFNYDELNVIASLEDGTIMGVESKKYKVYGVQFHPESILTGDYGKRILNNFLSI